MPWSIVNVPSPAVDAVVTGQPSNVREVIEQILADGYEPFAVTPLPPEQLMFSFRKFHADDAPAEDRPERLFGAGDYV